jgi:hypothetical protein
MGSLSAKMPLMSQKVRDFTDVLGHLGERKAPVDVSEVRVDQLAVQHTVKQCFVSWLVTRESKAVSSRGFVTRESTTQARPHRIRTVKAEVVGHPDAENLYNCRCL